MSDIEQLRIVNEYEQLGKLHEMWSKFIVTWGQVFVPLGIAIIAFFISIAPDKSPWLLLAGWLLFIVCMVYWRCNVCHIDKQIVNLYPRFIKLESRSGWEIQSRYYYNNFSDEAKGFIRHELGLPSNPIDFDDFANVAQKQDLTSYGLIGAAHARLGHKALRSRGHLQQNIIIAIISVIFLAYAICQIIKI